MSTPSNSPTTINYNGDTFTIPAWMQAKAGNEGLTRSELEQIAPIPADEEPYAITGDGNKIITNNEAMPIREGQQIGSVARFTAAGHLDHINVRRVNNELQILQGVQRPVNWTADLRFVVIEAVQLPANCRVVAGGRQHDHTNVMLVVPKGYGYGVPLKESYVNPGLRCLHGGRWVEPPHYFDEAKKFHRTEGAGERLALHVHRVHFLEADEQLSDLPGRAGSLPFGPMEVSASALKRNLVTSMKDTVPQSCDGRLTISEKDWSLLRQHLLQQDALERVAFLLVGRSTTGGFPEFFVHRVMPVQDDRCRRQSPVIIEPDTLTVLDNFGVFSQSSAPVFCHAHSHPFSGVGRFSGGDHAFLGGHVRSLKNYLRTADVQRDCLFLRIVLGKEEEGFEAEVHHLGAALVSKIRAIRIVGATGIRYLPNEDSAAAPSPAGHLDRNIRWLGEAGQSKVQRTRVAICGLGGVGAEVVKNLRGLGFRRYMLIDHDLLEATNLNRLPYRACDVGKVKVDLAASFIRDLDPEADIQCLPTRVEDPERSAHWQSQI
ncbi:MAG TPA: ThiF family adenylyltransferase [Terrimicrobiaceae bacterium]